MRILGIRLLVLECQLKLGFFFRVPFFTNTKQKLIKRSKVKKQYKNENK